MKHNLMAKSNFKPEIVHVITVILKCTSVHADHFSIKFILSIAEYSKQNKKFTEVQSFIWLPYTLTIFISFFFVFIRFLFCWIYIIIHVFVFVFYCTGTAVEWESCKTWIWKVIDAVIISAFGIHGWNYYYSTACWILTMTKCD